MMDKMTVKNIQTDLMNAAKFIEAKYGVSMHYRGGRYSESIFDMKLQFITKDITPKPVTETTIKGGYAHPGTLVSHHTLGRGVITKTNRVNYVVKFDNEKNLFKVHHYALTPIK